MRLFVLFACASLLAASELPRPSPIPKGTEIGGTYQTADESQLAFLIDGDPNTMLQGLPGAGRNPVEITLRFPRPIANLVGMHTGAAEAHHNYYAEELEWWADSTGDGIFETFLGRSTGLGPADESAGPRPFSRIVPQVHALRMVATKQSQKGVARPFTMNTLQLAVGKPPRLVDEQPVLAVVPIPPRSTARSSAPSDAGKGAELLIDGNCTTYVSHAHGSAREGEAVNITITFPQRVNRIVGIQLGRSCPHHNYYPQTMEILAGLQKNSYDTLVATVTDLGPAEASRRQVIFDQPLAAAHGLELRVTQQSIKELKRAFTMDEVFLIVAP